jgi:hypothetical protein
VKVLFQNHSSLLLQYGDSYLLTDPWYNQPAFGSWLPSLPPYIHPSYLAALGERLSILVSHGHDDHLDDRLLGIFNKETRIVTGNFKSPSVINRLKRLGFENIVTVGEDEQLVGELLISSYIVSDFSHDDAAYLIRNSEGAVIHANDNWHEFIKPHEELIKDRTKDYAKSSILLFSQTNSASGYPLNYRNFNSSEKQRLLKEKVSKMVCGALNNAKTLGIDRMFSYAGFATAYVKGKNYAEEGLFPTAKYLAKLLENHAISSEVTIPELYPGDSINLPGGEIVKAFVSGYTDEQIKKVVDSFYDVYGNKLECISYKELEIAASNFEEWIEFFLMEFDAFTCKRVGGPDSHYSELIGKEFSLEVTLSSNEKICKTIKFGEGLVSWNEKANKVCYVGESALFTILKGEALFEDLYTGYNAEWARNPVEIYNRDIVMMIVMFSYIYKNRISTVAKDMFQTSNQ